MDFKLRGKSLSVTQADVLRVTRDVPPASVDGRKNTSSSSTGGIIQSSRFSSYSAICRRRFSRRRTRIGSFRVWDQCRDPSARAERPERPERRAESMSPPRVFPKTENPRTGKTATSGNCWWYSMPMSMAGKWRAARHCPGVTARDEHAKRRSATCERPSGATWRVCAFREVRDER